MESEIGICLFFCAHALYKISSSWHYIKFQVLGSSGSRTNKQTKGVTDGKGA